MHTKFPAVLLGFSLLVGVREACGQTFTSNDAPIWQSSPAQITAGDVNKLPSLRDLRELNYEPSSAPESAQKQEAQIAEWVNTFQAFGKAVRDIETSKTILPRTTRGAVESKVYYDTVPAVVYIMAQMGSASEGKARYETGAGAILFPDDSILTNWHVVREAQTKGLPILVFLKPAKDSAPKDTLAYAAEVTFLNETKDLAVLKFREHPPFDLAELKIGHKTSVKVGQNVHVIGHPEGQTWSYSTGVISQLRDDYKATLDNDQHVEADVLQLQTAINPGNSGGPVMDDRDNLIALVSFSVHPAENIHYAIACNEIQGFMDRHDARLGRAPHPNAHVESQSYVSTTADGNRVMRTEYPGRTDYLISNINGKVLGSISDSEGVVVSAQSADAKGGFRSWRADYADGKFAEGSSTEGSPARIELRSNH